jgi:hypothetical protein
MNDDRRGRPSRIVTPASGRPGVRAGAGPGGQRPGELANLLRVRLAHARDSAARLGLSPEATAAVEDAVTYEPFVLENGILDALGEAGLAERGALLMPFAAEGSPRRRPRVLGELAGSAIAAQDGRMADAQRWLVAAEKEVAAARGSIVRMRAPALRHTTLLQPVRTGREGPEPGM